jgi:hypothetical protein
MDNPYLLRRAQHRIGKSGRASEKRLAKDLGARERPASGAMPGFKGDMMFGKALLEAKSTTQASMSVKFDWLVKIAKEALAEGKTPALSVSYVEPDGRERPHGQWALIPLHLFKEIFGDPAAWEEEPAK